MRSQNIANAIVGSLVLSLIGGIAKSSGLPAFGQFLVGLATVAFIGFMVYGIIRLYKTNDQKNDISSVQTERTSSSSL